MRSLYRRNVGLLVWYPAQALGIAVQVAQAAFQETWSMPLCVALPQMPRVVCGWRCDSKSHRPPCAVASRQSLGPRCESQPVVNVFRAVSGPCKTVALAPRPPAG